MSALLESTLEHLRALVSHDTRNPPRKIGTGGLFDYLRDALRDFDCTVTDHGAGAVSFFAVRGTPKLLFNVHLDTVPDSPQWSASPFELRLGEDRAIGLGACDIKGAAAALVAAAQTTTGPAAFLFTTDEEGSDARCIEAFLAQQRKFDAVLVAEPTRCEAVLAHRGICSMRMHFAGRAGHASGSDAMTASALHQAVRWSARALDYVTAQSHARFGGLTGLRFNIGRIEGGIKANMIAPTTELRFGFRPLPSMDTDQLLATFRGFAEAPLTDYATTFRGPSLPAGDVEQAESRRLAARDFADALGLPVGNAVDFWTEASLFSEAGTTTFVYGPGDIAQAHAADEWVAFDQLQRYAESVAKLMADRS
ncbi:MAG: acetylornithine deacetylase [Rhodanobacteraceae bacterium]